MNYFVEMLRDILSFGGISGVLALIITVTICVRYFKHGNEEIPQILTYALTSIIGFYFGTGVSVTGGADAASKAADAASKALGGP
jgi:uncharacterized membrane protein YfcA